MPDINDLLDTAANAIRATDRVADTRRGSDYEALTGPNAILWSRQSLRDTDLFRATRFGEADGADLTRLGLKRYGIERVPASRGQGVAILERTTLLAGAGTVWKGTRIRLQGGTSRYFRVTANTPVPATAYGALVPIESIQVGPGTAVSATSLLTVDDPLWDASWRATGLQCADGTAEEPADEYRARIIETRLAARPGQETSMEIACRAAGADRIAIFRSNYAGDAFDRGINNIYVGNLGYNATDSLVASCFAALRSVRVAGDRLQVLKMARVDVPIDIDVYLRRGSTVSTVRLDAIHRQVIIQYMNAESGRFAYSRTGIEAAVARTSLDIESVVVNAPASDAPLMPSGNFPDVLPRYFALDNLITIRYH